MGPWWPGVGVEVGDAPGLFHVPPVFLSETPAGVKDDAWGGEQNRIFYRMGPASRTAVWRVG